MWWDTWYIFSICMRRRCCHGSILVQQLKQWARFLNEPVSVNPAVWMGTQTLNRQVTCDGVKCGYSHIFQDVWPKWKRRPTIHKRGSLKLHVVEAILLRSSGVSMTLQGCTFTFCLSVWTMIFLALQQLCISRRIKQYSYVNTKSSYDNLILTLFWKLFF